MGLTVSGDVGDVTDECTCTGAGTDIKDWTGTGSGRERRLLGSRGPFTAGNIGGVGNGRSGRRAPGRPGPSSGERALLFSAVVYIG